MSSQAPTGQGLLDLIRTHYQTDELIPLHAPCFDETEKNLVGDCIDSTFVSSVGAYVTEFEQKIADYTGAKHAIAVVNGTMGLYLALKTLGVQANDLVITQSLTFIATANAIRMIEANPIFIDVDENNLSLSADDLKAFLTTQTYSENGQTFHTQTQRRVAACVPMHTLGFCADMPEIIALCKQYNINIVEDAAESLGSFIAGQHSGTFGDFGVFSFNGNKILTTGGGGMLITNDDALAKQAKHLSTTAKVPHAWLFEHDEIGYNLRMPNLNAALGVAQLQKLNGFLIEKRLLAKQYLFETQKSPGVVSIPSPENQQPNYWLNAVLFETQTERDSFLKLACEQSIQARPLWTPMHQLAIYEDEIRTAMPITEFLAERLVNIPSGIRCPAGEKND